MRFSVVCLALLLAVSMNKAEAAFEGVAIYDLDSKEYIYLKNADEYFYSASIQKVVTAYAALKVLGGDTKLKTSLYSDGKIKGNVLYGNLYIKFRGDVTLTSYKLKELFSKLDVKKITGKVIIDDSYFDLEYFHDASMYGDRRFCFNAPVSAIVIDQNCIKTSLKMLLRYIKASPSYGTGFKIHSEVKIENDPDAVCELELLPEGENKYKLYGCHKKGAILPDTLRIAVQDPRAMAKAWVEKIVSDRKIAHGKILFAKIPKNNALKRVAQKTSYKIESQIDTMLLESNNLIAGVLCKLIGLKAHNLGSYKAGVKEMKHILAKDLQVEEEEIRIEDCSGMASFITPKQMIKLLETIYKDKVMFKTIKASLPIAGKTGTLSQDFRFSHLKGKVFAKTGRMATVRSLAGYAFINKKRYAFCAIINNSFDSKEDKMKHIISVLEKYIK